MGLVSSRKEWKAWDLDLVRNTTRISGPNDLPKVEHMTQVWQIRQLPHFSPSLMPQPGSSAAQDGDAQISEPALRHCLYWWTDSSCQRWRWARLSTHIPLANKQGTQKRTEVITYSHWFWLEKLGDIIWLLNPWVCVRIWGNPSRTHSNKWPRF